MDSSNEHYYRWGNFVHLVSSYLKDTESDNQFPLKFNLNFSIHIHQFIRFYNILIELL